MYITLVTNPVWPVRERIYNEPEKVTPRDAVGCSNSSTCR